MKEIHDNRISGCKIVYFPYPWLRREFCRTVLLSPTKYIVALFATNDPLVLGEGVLATC